MASLNKASDEELEQVIRGYNKQLKLVQTAEQRINDLQSFKKLNKREESELQYLLSQHGQDIRDLTDWERDAKEADKILKSRTSKEVTQTSTAATPSSSTD